MTQKRQPVGTMFGTATDTAVTVDGTGDVLQTSYTDLKAKMVLDNVFNPIFCQIDIINNETNTLAVTGTGFDTLIPGDGSDFIPITGYNTAVNKDNLFTIVGGIITLPKTGFYSFDGWLSFRHTTNNSTVGVSIKVTPPVAPVVFTQNVLRNTIPNTGKISQLSGVGFLELEAGTTVELHVASDNTGTLTCPGSVLRVLYISE